MQARRHRRRLRAPSLLFTEPRPPLAGPSRRCFVPGMAPGLLLGGGGAGGGEPAFPAEGVLTDFFADNGATWPNYGANMHPAVYDAGSDRTYYAWEGWSGTARRPHFSFYDHTTGKTGPITAMGLVTLSNDDHGNPSLGFDHEGYMWGPYNSHASATKMASSGWPIGGTPGAPGTGPMWVARTAPAGNVTYLKPVSVGTALYVLYRGSATSTKPLGIFTTTSLFAGVAAWDAGLSILHLGTNTWAYAGNVVKRGTDLHVCVVRSANGGIREHVYYLIVDTVTRGVSNWDKSVTIAEGDLPVDATEADADFRIFTHSGGNGGSVPQLCFDSGDVPHVTFLDGTGTSYALKHMTVSGGAWTTPETLDTGIDDRFATHPIIALAGGKVEVIYPKDDDDRFTRGGSHMRRMERSAAGVWGSSHVLQVAGPYALDQPFAVIDGHTEARAGWCEIANSSNDTAAGNLRSFLWGSDGLVPRSVPAPVTTAKRYWRVLAHSNGGGSAVGLTQVEMYATKFGPNLCSGGTAIASSTNSADFAASKAFDGALRDISGGAASAQNVWASATAGNEYIGYDFGSGNDVVVNAIGIWGRVVANQPPEILLVESSTDGTTWTTEWQPADQGAWTENHQFRRYVSPGYTEPAYSGSPFGSHTYWRVVHPAGNSTTHAVAELQFRASPGGADQATGGTASASSSFNAGTNPVSNVFDDNASTWWAATVGLNYSWVQYVFGAAVEVGEIVVTVRSDAGTQAPADIGVQFSDDGTTWTTAWSIHNQASWPNGETRVFSDPDYTDADIAFLCGFDGTDAATSDDEESLHGHVLTFNGSASLVTAEKVFGASSVRLTGAADFISIAAHPAFNMERRDFCIEGRVKFNTFPSAHNNALLHKWGTTVATRSWLFDVHNGNIRFVLQTPDDVNAVTLFDLSAADMNDTAWHHAAITRQGTLWRLFIDGVLKGTALHNRAMQNSHSALRLGQNGSGSSASDCWLDEWRIKVGDPVYTDDFTVPAEAFARP